MKIFHFFKTNWFSVSLVLLLVLAFAKKNTRLSPDQSTSPGKRESTEKKSIPDKYTDAPPSIGTGTLMGFGTGNNGGEMPDIPDGIAMPFLQRFSKVAVEEQKKFGIPASVVLACAYINSFAGKRDIAVAANNYYAQPCSPLWKGKTKTINGKCYKEYPTAWESFRDFSTYLSAQGDFAKWKKNCGKNPEKWLGLLRDLGISDVDNFEKEAQKVISAYRLFELDK